jgi:hypothetical protein
VMAGQNGVIGQHERLPRSLSVTGTGSGAEQFQQHCPACSGS